MANILLIVYALTTSLALVFLKLGSQTEPLISIIGSKLHFNFTLFGISGIILYGISFIVYTALIAKYDLGYIIPLATGLVYVLIFVASFIIFKESFTMIKILGIVAILFGIVLLNIKQ